MTGRTWLFSGKIDLFILYAPVWVCWLIAFQLSERTLNADIPLWIWITIVIGIDVSHVWSSFHRTYFDKEEFSNHRKLLISAPVISFIGAFGLASISIDLFWRCLAYVAVYHFIRQQFGFMRIYKARLGDFRSKIIGDNLIIYLSMIYPVIYWHFHPDRNFEWFIEGDFFILNLNSDLTNVFSTIGNILYLGILGYWLVEEIINWRKDIKRPFPTGKILWVLTTAGNWSLGIIYFNSDLVFTLTNVVAHGVPYLALIIFYQNEKMKLKGRYLPIHRYLLAGILLITVFLFAFGEEYLWDLLVYRDNVDFFSSILSYPTDLPSINWQIMSIGFLAIPQITHYIIDGFIWQNNVKNPYVKQIIVH